MPPKVNKTEQEIKKLSKVDGNKTCADCPEKIPGYVDLTHNVFICTKCSGIHREYQFRVKGVSMSVFSEEDVAGLASMGNLAFNSLYLARLNLKDFSPPNGGDINKLKDFIRQKYIEKKWHRDLGNAAPSYSSSTSGGGGAAAGDDGAAFQDSTAAPPNNRMNINLNKTNSFSANRRASTGSVAQAVPLSAQKKPQAADIAMDLLGMNITSTSTSAAFDPFSTAAANAVPAPAPASAAGRHDASSGFDAFEAASSSSGAFDPFSFDSKVGTDQGFASFAPTHPVHPVGGDMTFVKPAQAIQPTETAQKDVISVASKNFSAFDDLLAPQSLPTAPAFNPFDSAGPRAHYSSPPMPYPPQPSTSGYPQHETFPTPYNGPPPPQQMHYGGPPPPQQVHYPTPPQQMHYGGPPPPQQVHYPPPPQMHYGGLPPSQQVYGGGPPPPSPMVPSFATPQPVSMPMPADPFSAMDSMAWGAAGNVVQPQAPQYSAAGHPSHAAATQSVNPFDLF